ncbi:MAG: ATP-grasp domain-containing protein [Methylobacter sp.]|nr:ATP-grasp domain-containing protein [Methylobacter sp.]
METILIVASSGRMLAQAAKDTGLKPLVIDLFADLDTQGYAEDFRQIKSLAEQDLAPAVDDFVERYAVAHVIYGSGFEYYPESLSYLGSRLTILGNHPDVFAKLQNKQTFFSILDDLNIPHPEIAFSAPESADGWLLKPMQGQGGVGIKRYRADDGATASVYWQKFQAGTAHSVLFLASGTQVQVIGFNTQWSASLSETQEFVFSGVINSTDLSDMHKSEITGWLKPMVPVFALKGLNSLDFIHADDCCYALEINPRPSASMQLYDEDLLIRHIQACEGDVGAQSVGRNSVTYCAEWQDYHATGYQIIHAGQDLIIPDHFEWPEWCMDLPGSGSFIRTGQPICSIIAHQKESQSVSEQLLTKQQLIINKLEGFHHHGIYS